MTCTVSQILLCLKIILMFVSWQLYNSCMFNVFNKINIHQIYTIDKIIKEIAEYKRFSL